MQISRDIKSKYVTFSKWSGKGYAVFASLGKVVKIAQLKVAVVNQAIRKNVNVITAFTTRITGKIIQELDEDCELLMIHIWDIFVVLPNDETCLGNQVNNIIIYKPIRSDFSWTDF